MSDRSTTHDDIDTISLLGMPLAAVSLSGVLDRMSHGLSMGTGGWLVTVNLDILSHFHRSAEARAAYLAADLRVADGMPLVWASHLQGSPLPERVPGSTLSELLLTRAADAGWKLLLLGGNTGSAERAATMWRAKLPPLLVHADSSRRFSAQPTQAQIDETVALVEEQGSQIVLVGLGSPKQELLIRPLRERLPNVWFVGVGGTFSFLAQDVSRAPVLLQRVGLEWLHRLAQEPQRLGRRYILDDLPVFFRLLTHSGRTRARSISWRSVR